MSEQIVQALDDLNQEHSELTNEILREADGEGSIESILTETNDLERQLEELRMAIEDHANKNGIKIDYTDLNRTRPPIR